MEAPRGVEPTGTNGRRRHSSPFPLVWGWVRVFAAAGLLATRSVVPVVTKRCSRPLSGSRTVTARAGGGAWVVFPFGRSGSLFWGVRAVGGGFCGGHGPGVTPGPFPNPEAKAWHGDGTAPGRVWESNTPPQTFVQAGFPVEPTLRETPLFLFPGDSSAPVLPHGSSPTGSQRGFPGSPLRIPIQTKRKTPLLRSLHI